MAFPIEATWKTSERAEGLAHDSSFPAADVWPQQPNLPTRDGLVAAELDTVRNELRGRINGAVIRQACGNPQPSLDLAMACVLAKPGRIPASVANVLGTHTKEDPSVLLDAAEAHD
jgi:hypothetical protein